MCPELFGFLDSYTLLIAVGVICCFIVFVIYFKRLKLDKSAIIDLIICGLAAILAGVIFACLFENLYEFIDHPSTYKWTWGLTFYGGIIGGVGGFLLMYFLFYKKHNPPMIANLFAIAPPCITIAHGFGRIGCFLAGCCYGIDSSAWYSIYFPSLGRSVIPTQLFEAIFLFILSGILAYFAFAKKNSYNLPIYMICYGVFRFLIEFIRGDDRGAYLGVFSPSQVISMIMIAGAIALIIIIKKFNLVAYEKRESN